MDKISEWKGRIILMGMSMFTIIVGAFMISGIVEHHKSAATTLNSMNNEVTIVNVENRSDEQFEYGEMDDFYCIAAKDSATGEVITIFITKAVATVFLEDSVITPVIKYGAGIELHFPSDSKAIHHKQEEIRPTPETFIKSRRLKKYTNAISVLEIR